MSLDRISLATFRNHAETRLDGAVQFNLLAGENGAGKTTILEAISLFAPGRGLRRAALSDMASKDGPGGFGINADLDPHDGGEAVVLATGTRADRPGRRLVHVNRAESTAIGLGEWLAVSWLTPAMDGLFTDSKSVRRRYMDRLAVAINPAHARLANRYDGALRERNRLLSDERNPDPAWLDSIEDQLADAAVGLTEGRQNLVELLAAKLAREPEQPFARPLLHYVPGGLQTYHGMMAELKRQRPRDRAARRTLTGPHRDELEVVMAGKNAPAAQCSTGEQKAMLIAMTLAHAELAAGGRPGILLLDEIAAHLDPVRRAALFERLRNSSTQVWLTGTELTPFEDITSEAAIWRVSSGEVERD